MIKSLPPPVFPASAKRGRQESFPLFTFSPPPPLCARVLQPRGKEPVHPPPTRRHCPSTDFFARRSGVAKGKEVSGLLPFIYLQIRECRVFSSSAHCLLSPSSSLSTSAASAADLSTGTEGPLRTTLYSRQRIRPAKSVLSFHLKNHRNTSGQSACGKQLTCPHSRRVGVPAGPPLCPGSWKS